SRYVILAAHYEVEAHSARFLVFMVEGGVGVELSEGSLVVHAPDGTVSSLDAPASWRSSPDMASHAPAWVTPQALANRAELWPVVRVARPDIVRWALDGSAIDGATAALRVEPGD